MSSTEATKTKYAPFLQQEDVEESINSTSPSESGLQDSLQRGCSCSTHRKSTASRRRFTDIAATIILTLVSMMTFQYIYHAATFDSEVLFHEAVASVYSEEARQTPRYHCGTNATEARAQGCIFDISLVGWVPEPCFDQELHQRFMDWGWRFFLDQEGTQEVGMEYMAEIAGTGDTVWVQHGYHITHCELAWQRMHRAMMSGKRTTTHLMNLHHTHHCGMMAEMRDDYYSLNSRIIPSLNTC